MHFCPTDVFSSFVTSILSGGRDIIKAFVGLLEHVGREVEKEDEGILSVKKSQEGDVDVQSEDNTLKELMEAVHSNIQDLLQTAQSLSKDRDPLITTNHMAVNVIQQVFTHVHVYIITMKPVCMKTGQGYTYTNVHVDVELRMSYSILLCLRLFGPYSFGEGKH